MKKIFARIGMELEITDKEYQELMEKAGTYSDGSYELRHNEFELDYDMAERFINFGSLANDSYVPEDYVDTREDVRDKEVYRVFVDMDGVLNKWEYVGYDTLYEKGFFRSREPNENVIKNVKELIKHPCFDVYVLSACLMDSPYAMQEKREWLEEYLPELHEDKYIFTPCGVNKVDYIPGGVKSTDILLDDYSKNLFDWDRASGIGIKVLNGVNNSKGTWKDYSSEFKHPTVVTPEDWHIGAACELARYVTINSEKDTLPEIKSTGKDTSFHIYEAELNLEH